jgi:CBS-domain-containing membrane protein
VSIAIMGFTALGTGQIFVFPSLGPTAFLIFDSPLIQDSSPRNAMFGHLVGVACAWFALVITGLVGAPSYVVGGVTAPRAIAAGLSLGLTGAIMIWLGVRHPPACATTLIVSLGILAKPEQLLVLMLGVALLVIQGFVFNRLAGVPYPVWSAPPAPRPETSPRAPASP